MSWQPPPAHWQTGPILEYEVKTLERGNYECVWSRVPVAQELLNAVLRAPLHNVLPLNTLAELDSLYGVCAVHVAHNAVMSLLCKSCQFLLSPRVGEKKFVCVCLRKEIQTDQVGKKGGKWSEYCGGNRSSQTVCQPV